MSMRDEQNKLAGGAVAMPERWGVRRAPGVNAYVLTAPEGDETLVDRPLVVRFLDDLAANHVRAAAALAQAADESTGGAPATHPAYSRGMACGIEGACMRIADALDGRDDGTGILGNPTLEALRRRLLAERSQGVPDRWREAVQSAAEAMDKAKKLLIVAGLVMEGGTISQPYNTALEGLRALLANAASPPQTERSQCGVPEGWSIRADGDELRITAPDGVPGGITLTPEGIDETEWDELPALLLYALGKALLSAAPAPDAVPAFRDRVSEIEDAVAAGTMNAYQCFTQMRQLVVAAKLDKPAPDAETPPVARVEVEGDFIVRTNREYAEWCATVYSKDALDERGHASLHGLWAWQAQDRRLKSLQQPSAPANYPAKPESSFSDTSGEGVGDGR